MDFLAKNIFGHFSEQPNSLKLAPRALKIGSIDLLIAVDIKMYLLTKNIFSHFLKQPNSLNLTRRALNLAL